MTSLQGSQTSLPESVELLQTSSEGSEVASMSKRSSTRDLENDALPSADNRPTNWRAVCSVSAIAFVTFLVLYTTNVSAFIYLKKIDKSATVSEQGDQKFSARLLHGISTAVLSALSYNTKRFRPSVQIGNAFLIASCVMYVAIEVHPESTRKFHWLVILALQAAAEGANTVLNAFIPRVSSKEDRMKAFSVLAGAEVIAVCLAPFVQMASNKLVTTEVQLLGLEWLKLSEFTLTIWLCLVLAVLNQFLISFLMPEPPADNNLKPFKESWRQAWSEIKNTDYPLLGVCIIEKCIACFGCTTILTLAPPYIAATLNMNESAQNEYATDFQAAAGICALATAGVFAFFKPVSRCNSTWVFLSALMCFFMAYFISIPLFDFNTHQLVLADDANPGGCNSSLYSWCEDYKIVDFWAWIYGTGCFFGVGFVMANISHDTIYSQLLGGIDQNVMTGMLIMLVDFSMLLVPYAATAVFKKAGPTAWWITVVITMACGLLVWVCSIRRMETYKKKVVARDTEREINRSCNQGNVTSNDEESGKFLLRKDINKPILH